jgi:phage baseplate assembly protein W
MGDEFIGSGWGFPVDVDKTGGIKLVSRDVEIEQSIRLILSTVPGERPMRPEFGCGIQDHVFDPADGRTATRIAFEVRESLRRWEPRIDVADVNVQRHPTQVDALLVDIRYITSDSNDPRNLVFPFYLIPTETETPSGVGGVG